jgi:hypothetical protein
LNGYLKESDYLEDLGVDRRVILKWMLVRQGVKVWIGFIWLSIEDRVGLL